MSKPDIQIKPLTAADLSALPRLFDYNDPAEMIAENTRGLEQGAIGIWGMYADGVIIGELRAKLLSDDPDFAVPHRRVYLYAFRVLNEYQGKGLGTRLITHVIDELAAVGYGEFTVGVEEGSAAARHIYNKLGFAKVIARKREAYQGDEYEYDLLLRQHIL